MWKFKEINWIIPEKMMIKKLCNLIKPRHLFVYCTSTSTKNTFTYQEINKSLILNNFESRKINQKYPWKFETSFDMTGYVWQHPAKKVVSDVTLSRWSSPCKISKIPTETFHRCALTDWLIKLSCNLPGQKYFGL